MMDQNLAKRKDGQEGVGQNRPMKARLPRLALLAATLATLLLPTPTGRSATLDGPPEARLLRFPDVRGDAVVFVYAGDVWRASTSGGPALRLTAHPGLELFPKLSHDGRWIAFSAEYTGTRQVWVMPAWGGPPRQLTFATDVGPLPPRGGWDNWVLGWTRDGKVLVRMNRVPWSSRMGRYYLVDPKGGLETPLEIPEGGSASFSPDGTRLAYCPVDREFRTWKRTKGGRAQDIWTYDFTAKKSERLTTWEGTDNFPMWWGDAVYFTSDREKTLNLWRFDLKTRETRKLTSFTEFDVLWPSLGDGKIVFMNGGILFALDLATEKAARIPITLGSDRAATVPAFRDVSANVAGAALSPSGARVVLDARGDLYSVPGEGRGHPEPDGNALRPGKGPGLVTRREVDRLPLRRNGRVRALDPPAGRVRDASPPHDGRGPLEVRPRLQPRRQKDRLGRPEPASARRRRGDGEGDGRGPERLRGHRRLLLLPRLPLARLREEPRDPPPGTLGPLARVGEVLPSRRRPDGRLLARLLGRRQVPLLPLQPRLHPGVQRLRVLLRLPEGDARLRGRPGSFRTAPFPAEERRGEGEGGGFGQG